MSTETDTDTEPSTRQRVIAAGVEIACRDGLDAVTHKAVAKATELSSSNVTYYFGTAVKLRRAVAQQIIADVGPPVWAHIESYVLDDADDVIDIDASIHPGVHLDSAEAFVWLARNGVTE